MWHGVVRERNGRRKGVRSAKNQVEVRTVRAWHQGVGQRRTLGVGGREEAVDRCANRLHSFIATIRLLKHLAT